MELAPPHLYPPTATDRSSAMIFELVFDKLLAYDDNQSVQPELADKFEIAKDGLTYTVTLKKNVKWHDGQPLTAKDVKFTVEAMCGKGSVWFTGFKKLKGATDYNEGKAKEVAGVQVVDDYTIKFSLNETDGGFLNSLVFWVIPEHIFKGLDVDTAVRTAWKPVGTGPFKFVQYKEDQFFEFDQNKDYFKGAPHIAKVFMKIAKVDAALAMLEKGEVDYITDLPATEVDRVKKLPNVKILELPNTSWPWLLGVNVTRGKLGDKRVRQALMYALDREAYIKSVMGGHATLLNHQFPMPAWAQPDPKDINDYKTDPEKAKALLKEAGWDPKTVITILYYPGNKLRDQFAVIAQQNWANVGVKADVIAMDVARAVEKLQKSDFDIILSGGSATPDPGKQGMYFMCDSTFPKGGANYYLYCNPKLDELFKKGQAALTQEERAPIFKEIAKILNDELPWLYLINPNYLSAVNTRINDMHFNPNIGAERFLDIEKWRLAQ
jgi:peptide/nickel transport system substrate-binding protein